MWAAVVVTATWQQSIIHTKRIHMSIHRLKFNYKIWDDDKINQGEEGIKKKKLASGK